MRERRELLLFLAVLALAALLTGLRLSDRYERVRVPAARTAEPEPLPSPPEIHRGPVPGGAAAERERSAFAPPRELLPLDPLELPDPPLPRLSVRRPAVVPALAGPAAAAYRMPAESLGMLDLGTGAAPREVLAAPPPVVPAGASGTRDGEALPEERYDWVVRGSGSLRVWGQILNEDPYGLRERAAEDLRFQMVSERTGRPLGTPLVIPRDDVADFGLARTFENGYRAATRALGQGAGAVAARKALALQMLAAWPAEALALDFALAEARAATAQGGSDPSAARVLTTVLHERNDLEGELTVLRRARDEGWADATLLADYALLARELGLPERAWELVEEARLASRASAEAALARGLLLTDEKRHEEALVAFRAATQVPFLPPLEERRRDRLFLATGAVLVALGQTDEAEREAQRLLLHAPGEPEALRLLGAARAARGAQAGADVSRAAEAWAEAAEAFGQAVAAAPGDGTLLTSAAIVAWLRRDGPTAARLARQAREVDPLGSLGASLALAFFHEDAGEPQAARELYAEALTLEPGNAEVLYRLGRNQRLEGDPEGAGATLRQALRLGGSDVLLLAELGLAALEGGLPEAAVRYFREALRLASGDGEISWLLGLAHLAEGDLLTAVEVLTAAASAGQGGAHAALGVAYYRRGRVDEALQHFDEVARAYAGQPEHPVAAWTAAQNLAVRDNLAKRQWLDRFGRSTLQRGWIEHHWEGSPRVWMDGKTLHVEGRVEKPREDERPGIGRGVEGQGFVSAEAELTSLGSPEARYGVSLTYRQVRGVEGRQAKARLEVWVDGKGVVRGSALDNFNTVVLDGVELGAAPVEPGRAVRLGIERLDDLAGTFAFLVDGRRVGQAVTLRSLRSFKSLYDLDLWAEAAPGRSVHVGLSLARIVRVP